jgi:hypothetical protein
MFPSLDMKLDLVIQALNRKTMTHEYNCRKFLPVRTCATFVHDLVWQLEFGDNNAFFVRNSGFAAEWWNNIWERYVLVVFGLCMSM